MIDLIILREEKLRGVYNVKAMCGVDMSLLDHIFLCRMKLARIQMRMHVEGDEKEKIAGEKLRRKSKKDFLRVIEIQKERERDSM